MANPTDPILIVGAGPTGLVLAIELARRGVALRIIDQRPHPLPWDRAAVVKARSLEIFEALGLSAEFLRRGKRIRGADFYDGTKRMAWFRLEALDTPFPFTLGLSENETESILAAELERLGVAVERGVTFTGMEIADRGVRATLRDANGDRLFSAGWVVGTDGLHSKVRDVAGIAFEGHDYPLLWGVVDARFAGWPHPDDVIAVKFNPPLIAIPIGGGKWRIYFRGNHDDKAVLAHIGAWLREYAPDATLVDPDEPQLFHTHCRVASKFRAGRVLLAGDAAHACSPMEGHGMNTGIQDAFNLGWKLALVATGVAPDSLLETYDTERRGIAVIVTASGDEAEAAAALPGRDGIEAIAAALAKADEQRKAAIAEAELALDYGASPILAAGEAKGPVTRIGQWVGDAGPLAGHPGLQRLQELIDYDRHTLFLLPGHADAAARRRSLEEARRLADRHGSRLKLVTVMPAGAVGEASPDMVVDTTGAAHARLGDGNGPCLCLVRPDGHLGLRCAPAASGEVDAYLAHIFG